jgi:hypothetical protein
MGSERSWCVEVGIQRGILITDYHFDFGIELLAVFREVSMQQTKTSKLFTATFIPSSNSKQHNAINLHQ